MNTQLQAQGAQVEVYMHGNNIALDPGPQTIDGFSGNMIKIDGITSILYDNVLRLNSGEFGTGSQVVIDVNSSAYKTLFQKVNTIDYPPSIVVGRITNPEIDGVINGLAASTTIVDGENDLLKIIVDGIPETTFDYYYNGSKTTISVKLAAGSYSPTEMAAEINSQLQFQGITDVEAAYNAVTSGTTESDSDKLVLKNNRMVVMIKEKLLGDVSLDMQAQSRVNTEKVLEFLM